MLFVAVGCRQGAEEHEPPAGTLQLQVLQQGFTQKIGGSTEVFLIRMPTEQCFLILRETNGSNTVTGLSSSPARCPD